MHGIIKIYNASSMALLNTNIGLNGHFIDEILPLRDKDGHKVSLYEELKNPKQLHKEMI